MINEDWVERYTINLIYVSGYRAHIILQNASLTLQYRTGVRIKGLFTYHINYRVLDRHYEHTLWFSSVNFIIIY